LTTTPASPTIPNIPGIVRLSPMMMCPSSTPKIESGMIERTKSESEIELNIKIRAMKIKNIAIIAACIISF